MQGYRPEQLGYGTGGPRNGEHVHACLLEQEFAAFESIEVVEYDAEMQEGSAHVGMSAVIDLVGRK